MSDTQTYRIQLSDQINVAEINATSPLAMIQIQVDKEKTAFIIRADQSGLIGLLRHLHARGLVFLSIIREADFQE